MNNTTKTIRITIASRESRLALWQAEHVQTQLQKLGHQVDVLGMTTLGDQILDRSLSKVGGKGLFVKELELALQDGRANLAVHSLKDMPMDLPHDLVLACVMPREIPNDAWVSNRFSSWQYLPQSAVVGTSSLRRTVLLHSLRPDLKIVPLRGNLDTRLRKLDAGEFDGIVLAAAGLHRLGLANRIATVFSIDEMLPAAGQGALGLEVRANDVALHQALLPLVDWSTTLAVHAERAVSRSMGGSCSMPLAAHAVWEPRTTSTAMLHLRAQFGTNGGTIVHADNKQIFDLPWISGNDSNAVATVIAHATQLGIEVAAALKEQLGTSSAAFVLAP